MLVILLISIALDLTWKRSGGSRAATVATGADDTTETPSPRARNASEPESPPGRGLTAVTQTCPEVLRPSSFARSAHGDRGSARKGDCLVLLMMRELRGTASEVVAAPLQRCIALLSAVDGYPGWYPDVVRDVEVLERGVDGQPRTVRTELHVARAGFARDFHLVMAVEVDARGSVTLTKVRADSSDPPFDVAWQLREHEGTRIKLDLRATLPVSRFLPLGGVGNSIAKGFVSAAREALATEGR
jgi:hypothetical protein